MTDPTPSTPTPDRLPLWIGGALLFWFVVNGQTGACRAAVDAISGALSS